MILLSFPSSVKKDGIRGLTSDFFSLLMLVLSCMKKIIAFLMLALFKTDGYYLLYHVVERQYNKFLSTKIDHNAYPEDGHLYKSII